MLLSPVLHGPRRRHEEKLLVLLAFLCGIKIVATCLTLGSGGSGGVIAPSLFLGATAGAVMGALLQHRTGSLRIHPEIYALVGMGAVLAAVVHAPLASILICFEVTEDYKVMVPAMLACVVATAIAARALSGFDLHRWACACAAFAWADRLIARCCGG